MALLRVVESADEPVALRLGAAEALQSWVPGVGVERVETSGVIPPWAVRDEALRVAEELAERDGSEDPAGPFVAVRLWASVGDGEAGEGLERVMVRGLERAAQPQAGGAAAAEALVEVEPGRVAVRAGRLMTSDDAGVRRAVMRVLGRVDPGEEERAALLAGLGDEAVSVREAARGAVMALTSDAEPQAASDGAGSLETAVVGLLSQENARARVEAAHLVGLSDWWSGAGEVAVMLRAPEPGARLAATSATRRLLTSPPPPADTQDAESSRGLLSAARARLAELDPVSRVTETSTPQEIDAAQTAGREAGQLLSGVAAAGYSGDANLKADIDRDLRAWLNPKSRDELARASAAWGLGELHRGEPDGSLVKALRDRLMDQSQREPESPLVQQAAARALAKIRGDAAMQALRDAGETGEAAAVLAELTGQPRALPPPASREWWLEPVGR